MTNDTPNQVGIYKAQGTGDEGWATRKLLETEGILILYRENSILQYQLIWFFVDGQHSATITMTCELGLTGKVSITGNSREAVVHFASKFNLPIGDVVLTGPTPIVYGDPNGKRSFGLVGAHPLS